MPPDEFTPLTGRSRRRLGQNASWWSEYDPCLNESYKSGKEWRLYIKFETNHTIWTNTKPLTGKFFLCNIFCRINEAFWERVHCQFLETFQDRQVRV